MICSIRPTIFHQDYLSFKRSGSFTQIGRKENIYTVANLTLLFGTLTSNKAHSSASGIDSYPKTQRNALHTTAQGKRMKMTSNFIEICLFLR
jgi:hypothetical protein